MSTWQRLGSTRMITPHSVGFQTGAAFVGMGVGVDMEVGFGGKMPG